MHTVLRRRRVRLSGQIKERSFMFKQIIVLISVLTGVLQAGVAWNEQNLTQTIGDLNSNGASVAMSGEWLAVGTYNPADPKSCAVFMYQYNYSTMSWPTIPTQTLGDAGGNCNGNKGFGAAISLSGTRLAVGLEDYGNKNVGAFTTYVYGLNSKGVLEWYTTKDTSQVEAPDAQQDSKFGTTISILGDKLVVGAPYFDTNAGTVLDAGKVYLYDFTTLATDQTPIATQEGSNSGDLFGQSVTGRNLDVYVGAPGYDSLGFTDNGALFGYAYNATTGLLTDLNLGIVGTEFNGQGLGGEIAAGENKLLGSGLSSQGFVYDGTNWNVQRTMPNTNGGDVSISNEKSAFSYLGRSVYIYPNLQNDYYVHIDPAGVSITSFAEDISFYKDQLVATEFDNSLVRVYDMPCGTGYTLTANEWAMIGVPCQIPAGTTVSEAFNTNGSGLSGDSLGTYGNTGNWVVYEQNSTYGGTSSSYVLMGVDDVVEQGKGYWIICDHNVTTRVDSTISSTRTNTGTFWASGEAAAHTLLSLPALDAAAGLVKVLLSNSLSRALDWNYSLISIDGSFVSMGSGNSPQMLTNATAYVYDTTQTGQPYRAISTTPGLSSTIEAGEGFWVEINATLVNSSTTNNLLLPYMK